MARPKKVLTDFAPPEAEAVMAEPVAEVAPDVPVVKPYEPPCKLDEVGYPAKLVVVHEVDGKRTPMLWAQDQFVELAKDDVAWKLPVGARVQRLPDRFVATQLDRPELEPMYGETARQLILAFATYLG